MRFAVMGPGLMSKRQKEVRKRQSFPGGLAADLSQASGAAKKAAAPKQKAKGKRQKARQGPAPPQKAAPVSAIDLAVDSSSSSEDESEDKTEPFSEGSANT